MIRRKYEISSQLHPVWWLCAQEASCRTTCHSHFPKLSFREFKTQPRKDRKHLKKKVKDNEKIYLLFGWASLMPAFTFIQGSRPQQVPLRKWHGTTVSAPILFILFCMYRNQIHSVPFSKTQCKCTSHTRGMLTERPRKQEGCSALSPTLHCSLEHGCDTGDSSSYLGPGGDTRRMAEKSNTRGCGDKRASMTALNCPSQDCFFTEDKCLSCLGHN